MKKLYSLVRQNRFSSKEFVTNWSEFHKSQLGNETIKSRSLKFFQVFWFIFLWSQALDWIRRIDKYLALGSSKHFGQPKETHLPVGKHTRRLTRLEVKWNIECVWDCLHCRTQYIPSLLKTSRGNVNYSAHPSGALTFRSRNKVLHEPFQ